MYNLIIEQKVSKTILIYITLYYKGYYYIYIYIKKNNFTSFSN